MTCTEAENAREQQRTEINRKQITVVGMYNYIYNSNSVTDFSQACLSWRLCSGRLQTAETQFSTERRVEQSQGAESSTSASLKILFQAKESHTEHSDVGITILDVRLPSCVRFTSISSVMMEKSDNRLHAATFWC